LIPFETGICVIKDWRIHNYIQKDRHQETQYSNEFSKLKLQENGSYIKNDDLFLSEGVEEKPKKIKSPEEKKVVYFKDKNTWKEIIAEYEKFYELREKKKIIWDVKELAHLKNICSKINLAYDNCNLAFADIFISIESHWKYIDRKNAALPSRVISDLNDLANYNIIL
jgi:hypothetical protein